MSIPTEENLKHFQPQHSYFIGFDSDGCVFDSMELKHKECFIPIQKFIDSASALGNPTLKEAIAKTNDPALKHLLAWSEAVNRDIESMVKGLPPFPHVRECFRKL